MLAASCDSASGSNFPGAAVSRARTAADHLERSDDDNQCLVFTLLRNANWVTLPTNDYLLFVIKHVLLRADNGVTHSLVVINSDSVRKVGLFLCACIFTKTKTGEGGAVAVCLVSA